MKGVEWWLPGRPVAAFGSRSQDSCGNWVRWGFIWEMMSVTTPSGPNTDWGKSTYDSLTDVKKLRENALWALQLLGMLLILLEKRQ